jgi:hypothetical protein
MSAIRKVRYIAERLALYYRLRDTEMIEAALRNLAQAIEESPARRPRKSDAAALDPPPLRSCSTGS